ncbi:MAG: O-antigen ligase family protein [Granulosicoccus sp.]
MKASQTAQQMEASDTASGAMKGRINPRRAARASGLQRVRGREADMVGMANGWPSIDGLKPVFGFLVFPVLLLLGIMLTGGGWPPVVLYPIALCLGLYVAVSVFRGPELMLACLLVYLPFSKLFVIPLAPGVNGTNMLILLGLFAVVLQLGDSRLKPARLPAGAYLVLAFGLLTALSAFTITLIPGGRVFLLYGEILSYKAWLDQFVFYFIVLICIRDIEMAKRCFIYMLLGSMLVVLFTVPEMFEKMGRSSIEKSRLEGPQLQSNNFGGFVAYSVLPLAALFLVYIRDIRAWLLAPYLLLAAKMLIASFSRGAYLAILVGGLLAGWFRGKGFLAAWLSLILCVLLAFPSLIPEAIVTRMQTLTAEDAGSPATEERLDKSSVNRLILWKAAVDMTAEDPVWGKGFKGFQLLKSDYTETTVRESDPHSMYLYISSQMGLPSLALFLAILGYSFYLGRQLSRHQEDRFIRAIGIGGAAATACLAVVCIFGSRAVSLSFSVYFWALLVIMQIIKRELAIQRNNSSRAHSLNNASIARNRSVQLAGPAERALPVSVKQELADPVQRTGGKPTRGAAAWQARQAQASKPDAEPPVGPAKARRVRQVRGAQKPGGPST